MRIPGLVLTLGLLVIGIGLGGCVPDVVAIEPIPPP